MIETVCKLCGATFRDFASKKRQFCSSSCATKWSHQHGTRSGKKPGRKTTGRIKPCEHCGAEIYVKPFQERDGLGRFCSVACYNAWQSRNGETRPCEWCGGEMRMSPSSAEIRRFCSWPCQVEGRRKATVEIFHNGRRASQDRHGYIRVWEPEHPNAYQGWVLQHRLVMEQQLGRLLETAEHVHHLDQDRTNNDVSNLVVLGASDHQRETIRITTARNRVERDELSEYRKRFGPLA